MTDSGMVSATESLAQLRDGEVSSRELVEASIARIEAQNPELNAVVAKDFERATERAQQSDQARGRGEDLGPLHGLPMTIKDSIETAGLVTTSGAPELRDHVPTENAVAVQRLVDAGAIVLGKTNLPMYATDWQTYNDVYGRTNNPWDLERTVGGSSGGAAAALAAGFVPLELGSDFSGSLRVPASHCGVFSHKPTHGIVPFRGHIPGPPGMLNTPDLAVLGPMARTASDLDLALGVLAGPDTLERDGWALALPPPRADALADVRVRYWLDDPLCPIDDGVRAELEATIESLRPHVQLMEVDLPFELEEVVGLYMSLAMGVIGGYMPRALSVLADVLGPFYTLMDKVGIDTNVLTKDMINGFHLSHFAWNDVNERRTRLRWACRELFRSIDVLLTPAVPVPAFPHQTSGNVATRHLRVNGAKRPYLDHVPWIALATTAYLPATTAPVGLTHEGLPVGVQIVGPHLADKTTIRFAELLAEVHGGFRAPSQAVSTPATSD